jgi:Protein of unknown function (DUF1826)
MFSDTCPAPADAHEFDEASLAERDAFVTAESAGILAAIRDSQVHLAVWRRSLPEDLAGLTALDLREIDDIDQAMDPDTLADTLPALLVRVGYGVIAGALAREIATLGQRFAAIMRCDDLRLRLEVIETDACRRFHADMVTSRMLAPLVGPGTQWIHTGSDGPAQALRPGEVGMFKGRLWASEPRILHRSPPIAATGETRLLLAIDPYVEDDRT